MSEPLVSVIVGSKSDAGAISGCREVLNSLRIPHEARVLSAHRTPRETAEYAEGLQARGVRVVIAGAGMSAALAGVVAAHTILPVLGVPLASGSLQGVDALLSVAQMPPGVPVGCLAVGPAGGKNAAYLAARILALDSEDIRRRVEQAREAMRESVLAATLPDPE